MIPAACHADNSDSVTPSTPASTTSFTLFTKLPLELRRMIWRSALPGRIIEVSTRCAGGLHSFEAPPSVPLMAVCQESRKLALEQYELIHLPHVYDRISAPFYFSAELDICLADGSSDLFPDPPGTPTQEHLAFRQSIKTLAFDIILAMALDLRTPAGAISGIADEIAKTPDVQKIILMVMIYPSLNDTELREWMEQRKRCEESLITATRSRWADSRSFPEILRLPYRLRGERSFPAMKKSLLRYVI